MLIISNGTELSAEEILTKVTDAVNDLVSFQLTDGRTGGYFCLLELESGEMLIPPTMVGKVTNGKDDQYIRNCLEKATRLSIIHQMRERTGSAWSFNLFPGWTSFELRDEARHQWGGAISTSITEGPAYIFSISGFPEEIDEASMISATVRLGVLSHEQAVSLASRVPHPDKPGNAIAHFQMRSDGTFLRGLTNDQKRLVDQAIRLSASAREQGDHVRADALNELIIRLEENASKEKISNGSLRAGSPMYYYCQLCTVLVATLPESHTQQAPKYCDGCKKLKDEGWLP